MQTIISKWLYSGEDIALQELREFAMKERNEMAAKAQAFADWLTLQNSRDISEKAA